MLTNGINDNTTALHELNAKRYPSIRQSGKQSEVEHSLYSLERVIEETSHATRAKIEKFESFQTHLQNLYETFEHTRSSSADEEVDRELNVLTSRRAILFSHHLECPYCLCSIRREHLDDHMLLCKYCFKRDRINETFDEDNIAVRPHPLRNLRLIAVSFDSIHIDWDLPIFQGGEPIIDSEVSYSYSLSKCNSSKINKSTDKMIQKNLSCLRFCKKGPMAKPFVIDGLYASKEYFDLKVRCKTSVGWSDYSKPIQSVKTKDPISPLKPQRFHIKKISSDSISFSWEPPYHSGGGALDEYELIFEQSMIRCNQEAGRKNQKIDMVAKTLRLRKEIVSFTLSDLSGSTLLKNIRLRAINSFGLIGDYATCEDVKTHPPLNSKNRIIEEIKRVRASSETIIDSDFFQPGVLQREQKLQYLEKLENLLKKFNGAKIEDTSEVVSDKRSCYRKDTNDLPKPLEMRAIQFESKILLLQNKVKELDQELEDNRKNVILSRKQMGDAQDKIHVLQRELNSLTSSSEELYSSGILSGSIQVNKKADLHVELRAAIEENITLIANLKLKIMEEDKKYTMLVASKSWMEEQLKERISKYHIFKTKLKSASILRTHVLGHVDLLQSCMKCWIDITRYNTRLGRVFESLHRMRKKILIHLAVKKWKENTQELSPIEEDKLSKGDSKGSRMLFEMQMRRQKACDEIKSSMINLVMKNKSLAEAVVNLKELPSDFVVELIRADNCNYLGDHDSAIELYQSILNELSNKSTPASDYFLCIVKEKLASSLVRVSKWNTAIVHLEYLYCRAEFIKDDALVQRTESMLAKCFFETGDFDSASEKYHKVIERKRQPNCNANLSEAYFGLSRCYDCLNDFTRASYYFNLYKSAIKSLEDSTKSVSAKAKKLEEEIVKTSFREGKIVSFQRVSANYMPIQKKIRKLLIDEESFQKESLECRKEIESLHILVKQLDDEIEVVTSRDSNIQTSHLLHDNYQQIEREELLKRLTERKYRSAQILMNKRNQEENVLQELKNRREDRQALEADLRLEKNQLMQNVLSKRLVRCAKFNEMNQNSLDAFGQKSSGRSMIVLTIDSDVFVHEMKTGTIKYGFSMRTTSERTSQHMNDSPLIITCAHYSDDRVYVGTIDRLICCWNMVKDEIEFVAKGHSGMLTCIFVENSLMMSGSIDRSVILWDSSSGQMLCRGLGHSRGISSIYCGSPYYISGDLDGDIIIWEKKNSNKKLERKYRLHMTQCKKISVIRCSKYEVICGDETGFVMSWWLDSTKNFVLHETKVHEKMITDIQFDAKIMVTSSFDTTLKILDVTSFQILQTIRGHETPILSVCFDTTMILSLSNDGIMKQWIWNSKKDTGEDIYHTFSEGDSMRSISEHYGVTVKDLMKWNVNRDIKKITVGQSLIVVKGSSAKSGVKTQPQTASVEEICRNKETQEKRDLHNKNIDVTKNQSISKFDRTSLASRFNR